MIHRIFLLCLAFLVVIQPLGCFRQELGPFEGDIRGVLNSRLVRGIAKRKLLPFGINGQELVKISIEEYEKDGRSFSSDFGKILDWKELDNAEMLFFLTIGVRKEDGNTRTMDSYVQLFGEESLDDREVLEGRIVFVDFDNDGWPELNWRSNRNKVFVLSSDATSVGIVDYKTLPK